MGGHVEFTFNLRGEASGRRGSDRPFNLLILADLSGRQSHAKRGAAPSPAMNRTLRVDLDNVDELWAAFEPSLRLDPESIGMEFSPRDIEDFHPDRLFHSLPLFQQLRETRKNLQNPATAADTLNDLLGTSTAAGAENETGGRTAPAAGTEEDAAAMFERLLGKPAAKPVPPVAVRSSDSLESYIRRVVAPHVVAQEDPKVGTAIDSVDRAVAELMRAILHRPDFQALEATWRSLLDLVSQLELDEFLSLQVCNISKQELLALLPDPGVSLQDSALFELLVERRRQASDDSPWTVILADYYFGPAPEDVALLTGLGAAVTVQGGILLGGARRELLGCRSSAELADARYWSGDALDFNSWTALRKSPFAPHIGLALPRLLLRLPYGADGEAVDAFALEEMPERSHEHYLWANPAWACARLLAQSFTREGWNMEPGDHVDLGDLPAHHYREEGESRLQPCAELLLSESTMVAILEQGLMPMISYRNRNTAVLGRFQSIADPLAPLAGPWAGE